MAVDYFLHPSQNAAAGMRISPLPEEKELPTYDPIVEMANKEKRIKFAENAVHVIPFLLMLCAFTLWFFSNPGKNLKYSQQFPLFFGFSLMGTLI